MNEKSKEASACLLCFKYQSRDVTLDLQELSTTDVEGKTYLEKVQYVMNSEVAIYEGRHVCSNCIEDLDRSYQFKVKLAAALTYWSKKFSNSIRAIKSETFLDFEKSDTKSNNQEDNEDVEKAVSEIENEIEEESPSFTCCKCNDFVVGITSELLYHQCSCSNKPGTSRNTSKIATEDGKRKFLCIVCGQGFKQSFHLREHLTIHTGERNYSCDICKKSFQRKSSLQRHTKSHNAAAGEKAKKRPFECTICGKQFPYSNSAQRHMRIHSGDRRYHCKLCDKRFTQTTHLKVHMMTHTGENLYVCEECGESFKENSNLQEHMKKHQKKCDEDMQILENLDTNFQEKLMKNDEGVLGDDLEIESEQNTDNFKIEIEDELNFSDDLLI